MRILHAPLYGPGAAKHPNLVTSTVRGIAPDVVGFSEAYRILEPLQDLEPKYAVSPDRYPSGLTRRERRGYGDTATAAKAVYYPSFTHRKQAEGIPASKIAPARYVTETTLSNGVVHLNAHLHAAVLDYRTGGIVKNRRGNQYREQTRLLLELVNKLRSQGADIVLSGDFNLPDRRNEPDPPSSLYRALEGAGWSVYRNNLDAILLSPGLRFSDSRSIAAPKSISDHPWLLADVEPRK